MLMKKRILLTAAAAFVATIGFAQVVVNKTEAQKTPVQFSSLKAPAAKMVGEKMRFAPKKTKANGVYYTRPAGTLYWGSDSEGRGWSVTRLVLPPFYDVTFTNKSTDPTSTSWLLNGTDVTQYADAETGNFNWGSTGCYNGSAYYLPTISDGTSTYTIGESGKNSAYAAMLVDSISDLAFYDSYTSSVYGWGSLSTGYLYGTGTVSSQGVDYTSYGVMQVFDKPAAPLYIESFNVIGFSSTSEPLKNGAKLMVSLLKVVETAEGNDSITDDVLAQFTAGVEDTTFLSENDIDYTSTGKAYVFNFNFANKSTDAFGAEVIEPAVINDKFAIFVTGFNQDGVDVGLRGPQECADDDVNNIAYFLVADEEGNTRYFYYNLGLDFSFVGGFDYIEAADELYSFNDAGEIADTYSNLNVLRVSADGQTVSTEGADDDHNIGAAILYTSFPWFDAEGAENYTADNIPDWITGIYAEDAMNESGYRTGQEYISVECEALPAGTTGRTASLYFTGKGYASELPVIILQGDVTVADGIEQLKADAAKRSTNNNVYNLAGQRINKSAKGLQISNGKKFINK